MSKLLIVGGDRGIGSALFRKASSRGMEVVRTTRKKGQGEIPFLDMERPYFDLDFFRDISCACLCAAISGFSDCERDAAFAQRVNVDGILEIARACLDKGCFVIFLSSSAVFDGSKQWPDESEACTPTTEYGRQKALAEKLLLEMDEGRGLVAVVRLTKVLTNETPVIKNMLHKIYGDGTVEAFQDLKISPVSMEYVVAALLSVASKKIGGIFHLSGEEEVSYVEFARRMAIASGGDPKVVKVADSSQATIHFRPEFPGLGMRRTRDILGLQPDTIEGVLGEILS